MFQERIWGSLGGTHISENRKGRLMKRKMIGCREKATEKAAEYFQTSSNQSLIILP